MSIVTGQTIGTDVLKALGLEGVSVTRISLNINIDEVVTVDLTMLPDVNVDELCGILKGFKLVEIEE